MHICIVMSAILHIFFIFLGALSPLPDGNVGHGASQVKTISHVHQQNTHQLKDDPNLLVWEIQEDVDDENQNSPWTPNRTRNSQKINYFFKQHKASKKSVSTNIVGPSRYKRFCNYRI
jgi:hypothetical protein